MRGTLARKRLKVQVIKIKDAETNCVEKVTVMKK